MKMKIRPAVPQDASALAELGAATFTETFGHLYSPENLALHLAQVHSPEKHLAMLNDRQLGVWVATENDGYLVGYAVAGRCKLPVEDAAGAGELWQIYVRSSHQQHKLGSQLMHVALEWLEQRHAPLYIGVWSENVGAQRLYARYGFQKVGEYRFRVGKHFDTDYILKRNGTAAV